MKKLLVLSVALVPLLVMSAVQADEKSDLISAMSAIKTTGQQDCSQELFAPTASDKSLISWSKNYHEDAELALVNADLASTPGGVLKACYKAVQMRGAASCIKPTNADYKSKLIQSVDICQQLISN